MLFNPDVLMIVQECLQSASLTSRRTRPTILEIAAGSILAARVTGVEVQRLPADFVCF